MKFVRCGVALSLRRLGAVFACTALLFSLTGVSQAEERTITMYNIHTKETASITFKRNGKYVPEGLQAINHFMRDWRVNRETRIDPALIDIIWEMHEQLGSKAPVHLICGYRSPATNEMLRRTSGGQARHSRHITGQAADLMFPDVPLKQLRYSALILERGGVGYYPRSGIPFVHVDTGNVRHWPGIPRTELAMLFPKGHSLHVPSDGRPLTPADYRVAMARLEASGGEKPWALNRRRASGGPMLASLTPTGNSPLFQRVSLTSGGAAPAPQAAKPEPLVKPAPAPAPSPESAAADQPDPPEPQLADEGEENEDEFTIEPLPAAFLLSETPIADQEILDDQPHDPVLRKTTLLLSPPSTLASEEFDRRLQIEELYEANVFKGRAIAFAERLKARMAAAKPAVPGKQAMR